MNKTYIKIIIQEIKHSIGRFAAIFGIVALSVGFLSGLLATTPDMKATADDYFDENQMADIFIKGTGGLTDKDLALIDGLGETEEIMPAYVMDTLVETDDNGILNVRVYGLDILNEGNNINKLTLESGRMPQNKYECLVEKTHGSISEISIGEKIKISDQNDDFENIGDIYDVTEYRVVGIVSNPFYFSVEIERSNIGNGRLASIIYVDESSYSLDVYTDFYISLKDASAMMTFDDDYEDYIEENLGNFKDIGKKQSIIRHEEIVEEANEKLNEAKVEYRDAKEEAERELADAAKEIEDAWIELGDAERDIQEGKIELADAKVTLDKEIADAKKEIQEGYDELAEGKIELEDGEKQYAEGIDEINEGIEEYGEGLRELLEGEKDLKEAQKKFDEGEEEFLEGLRAYEDGRSDLDYGERELDRAKDQLESAEIEYSSGLSQLNSQKAQFDGLASQIIGLMSLSEQMEGIAISSTEDLMAAIGSDPMINGVVTGILVQMALEGYPVPQDADQMLDSYNMLKAGEASLEAGRREIVAGWREYDRGLAEIRSGREELDKAEEEIEKARKELEKNRKKLQEAWDELEKGRKDLADGRKKIEDGDIELAEARIDLDQGWKDYYQGLKDLEDAELTLEEELEEANRKILDGEIELADGIIKYEDGLKELQEGEAEYLDAKATAEKELQDAAVEIAEAEEEIADIEIPKWYVLDRNSNISYLSFAMNVEKVADVARVFPIFFFAIAALVTLTTMTRMVEEERTQIGTLKALGYKKSTIVSKYIIYCGLASISGSIVGLFLGFRFIPEIIWEAYRSMYYLPDLKIQFIWEYALPISLISVLSTVLVTFYVSMRTLEEKPSTLMLPRAPKPGKRIFLERIKIIWSRMKFSHKSTARNILRYKRHFFMTVTGIAGCTALMLTGFGLLDSIGAVANTQFEEIFKYDLTIQLEEGEKDDLVDDFLKEYNVYADVMMDTMYLQDAEGEELAATLVVPKDPDDFKNVVTLRDRLTGNIIPFTDKSVVMTEKLAETLDLNIGDKFTTENEDGLEAEFVLTDLTENYVGIYLYINGDDYSKAFNEEIEYNTLMVDSNIEEGQAMDDAIEKLLKGSIMSAEPLSQLRKSFDILLSNINIIVMVLVISSGALAFIVLYNLTNINISERRKELSTLKVLGYHKEEIEAYVFRESAILCLVGIIVGLFLGSFLHTFVLKSVEGANLMLGREISVFSYLISAILTLIFSLIVNLFMKIKLSKIEMVESMKATE